MQKIKLLYSLVYLLLPCLLGSCRSTQQFDFRTYRQPDSFKRDSTEFLESEPALTAAASPVIQILEKQIRSTSFHEDGLSNNLTINPLSSLSSTKSVSADASASQEAAPIHSSQVLKSKGARQAVKDLQKDWQKNNSASSQPEFISTASLARNPLNQGIIPGLLIMGLGIGIIYLGTLLPTVGTILGWIIGVDVVLLGLGFLILTLMGFNVRIFG
jgi:hypothetical protein